MNMDVSIEMPDYSVTAQETQETLQLQEVYLGKKTLDICIYILHMKKKLPGEESWFDQAVLLKFLKLENRNDDFDTVINLIQLKCNSSTSETTF